MRAVASYAWKTAVCAVAFFIGLAPGGALAAALGIALPAAPPGVDARQLMLGSLLASPLLGATLGALASRLRVGYLPRLTALWLLGFVCLGANGALETTLFSTVGGGGGMLLVFLPATLACAAVAAALFRPAAIPERVGTASAGFAGQHTARSWLWRLAAALVAFPAVYFAFGMMVGPFVIEAYRAAAFALQLPSMGQLVPIQFLRSAFFLIASLPVLAFWTGSRLRLALCLGLVQYAFVALFGLIQASWLPLSLRLLHGAETAADSFVYASLLVALLVRSTPAAGSLTVAPAEA